MPRKGGSLLLTGSRRAHVTHKLWGAQMNPSFSTPGAHLPSSDLSSTDRRRRDVRRAHPLPSTQGHLLPPVYDTSFKVSILQLTFWVQCWPFLYFLLSDVQEEAFPPPQSHAPFQSFLVVLWRPPDSSPPTSTPTGDWGYSTASPTHPTPLPPSPQPSCC